MKYSFVFPILALASSVLSAPAVVTETNVVVVTAAPATPTASAAPKVGDAIEVIVSKLVEIRGDVTQTKITTFTNTVAGPAATSADSVEAPVLKANIETTNTEAATTEAQPTTSSPKPTTVLEPSTTPQQKTTSPAAQPASTGKAPSDGFASEILNAHNTRRSAEGASPLSWSDELAAYAQAYADKYDCSGNLVHSGGPYGENLGVGYSTTGAVDAWYNEKGEYNPQSPVASHFTQVVWKSTTQLGCARKTCNNIWGQYTICSYNPAGNVAGQYAQNV